MPEKQPIGSKPNKLHQVLVGSWNAIQPEHQGKKALEWYDKLKFSPATPEEKKVKDTLHRFLKNNPKLVGWTAVATEAALLAGIVVGIRKIRNRDGLKKPLNNVYPILDVKEPETVVSYMPGSLVPMHEKLAPWKDGAQWIINYCGSQNGLRGGYEGFEEERSRVVSVLERAARAFDAKGIGKDPQAVAWKAGTIAGFLLDDTIMGKLRVVEQGLPLSDIRSYSQAIDLKLGLVALLLSFGKWMTEPNRGGSPEHIFEYWARTLKFAGLPMVLPSGYDIGIARHRSFGADHNAEAMQALVGVYEKWKQEVGSK